MSAVCVAMGRPQANISCAFKQLCWDRTASSSPLRLQPPPRSQRWRRQAGAPAPTCSAAAKKKVFRSFEDMLAQSSEPVLVEFYATWCGPCQMMGKILDEVAPGLRGRVRFVKVESERYPSLASRYHVSALPTLILFKNGQPADRVEGVLLGPDLRNRLEYMLAR